MGIKGLVFLTGGVFDKFVSDFNLNFIAERRYLLLLEGLGNTLILSTLAAVFGITIGVLITFCKLSQSSVLKGFAGIYVDIIRATPAFTQLLVIYFVIFGNVNINKLLVGGLAFGINSGAYVSEIIRAGILSIDHGQTEAGRSLGLSQGQTMRYIILPQAVKNILPALANEFIVLIKETSIAGYIAVMDIMKAATTIQSRTFNPSMPLLASAVIYYIIIKTLTVLFSKMETTLRKADARS